uniref:Uncharacterized protein n=1 Tax=Oryza sativa subsp. japonica TaxID=39947 RepID=Q6ETL9_ORYSJ|nr:hypothetical protein [Oryza sativa Japonica Group]
MGGAATERSGAAASGEWSDGGGAAAAAAGHGAGGAATDSAWPAAGDGARGGRRRARRATARAAARETRGVDGDVGPREEAAEQVELLVLTTTTTTTRSSGAAMALAELRRGEGVGDMADKGSACAREIWPPPPQAPRAPSPAAGHALSVAAREEASSSGRPAGDEAAHAG